MVYIISLDESDIQTSWSKRHRSD